MLDAYRGGYRKALLDVYQLLEHSSDYGCLFGQIHCKSKKQFVHALSSFLNTALTDPLSFDALLDYGPSVAAKVSPDGSVLKLGHDRNELRSIPAVTRSDQPEIQADESALRSSIRSERSTNAYCN